MTQSNGEHSSAVTIVYRFYRTRINQGIICAMLFGACQKKKKKVEGDVVRSRRRGKTGWRREGGEGDITAFHKNILMEARV